MLRHVTYKRNEKDFATRVIEDDSSGAVSMYVGDGAVVTAVTNELTGKVRIIGPGGDITASDLAADTAPRPKRWITSDAIPIRAYSLDNRFVYGVIPAVQHKLYRCNYLEPGQSPEYTGYQCAANSTDGSIIFSWSGGVLAQGEVFILEQIKVTEVEYTFRLMKSTDYGATFALSYDFGVGTYVLDKGFAQFKRGGQIVYAMIEYNVRENYGITRPFDGTAPDAVRYFESYDNGASWTVVATWNVGVHHVRHGHCVDVDPYSDPDNQVIYIGFGDQNPECAIVRVAPGCVFPADLSFSNLAVTPGFTVAHGHQTHRTVGGIFTPDHYITGTDSHSASLSEKATLGIRLWDKSLAYGIHVDRSLGVDSRLAGHNLWFGQRLANGDLVMYTQPSSSVGAIWRGSAVLTSGDNGETWHFSGWLTAPAGRSNQNPRIMAQGANGKIFIGIDALAGCPSGRGYVTLVCEQTDDDFIESRPDILGPVYFVDHANGSDASNGLRPGTAWASVRKALQSSAITYGSVVRVLNNGALVEPNTIAVVYNAGAWDATYSGPGPTDAPVQIRANASYAATLTWASGTTIIGSGTHRVDIEFDGVGIVPPDAATNWWSSHSTDGACAYRLKDAVFGSKTSNSYFYLKCGTIYAERATLRGGPAASVIATEPSNALAKGFEFKSSLADLGGYSLVNCNHATLFTPVIDQSTFIGYGSQGAITVAAASTTKPVIRNSAFLDSYRPCILDASATPWAGNEVVRSYIGAGAVNNSAVAIPTATSSSSNIVESNVGPCVNGISPVDFSPLRKVGAGSIDYGVDRNPLTQPLAGASD